MEEVEDEEAIVLVLNDTLGSLRAPVLLPLLVKLAEVAYSEVMGLRVFMVLSVLIVLKDDDVGGVPMVTGWERIKEV